MILITGGSGFIGTHFYHALADKFPLVNLDLNEPQFPHPPGTYVKGDIRVKDDITKCVKGKGVKTIVSLAAKHHDFGIGHDEYFDTNEDGTKVLCEVATENGINEIVFYSSVAVYGLRNDISHEAMEPRPDSPYGASKLAGEKVLRDWAKENAERKVIIIRPTVVFGPGNYANMFNLIRQIESGFYFHLGKADKVKSIAYVENVVNATIFLMSKIQPGVSIYNYSDEPQMTTREISTAIAQHLGKKIHLTLPKKLGLLFGLPFDVLIKITGKNFPISTARINKLDTATNHSARKIFSEGYSPDFSTLEGLEKMVKWYKERRLL